MNTMVKLAAANLVWLMLFGPATTAIPPCNAQGVAYTAELVFEGWLGCVPIFTLVDVPVPCVG